MNLRKKPAKKPTNKKSSKEEEGPLEEYKSKELLSKVLKGASKVIDYLEPKPPVKRPAP